jgi:RIO-like serine/threonine protein kinase
VKPIVRNNIEASSLRVRAISQKNNQTLRTIKVQCRIVEMTTDQPVTSNKPFDQEKYKAEIRQLTDEQLVSAQDTAMQAAKMTAGQKNLAFLLRLLECRLEFYRRYPEPHPCDHQA